MTTEKIILAILAPRFPGSLPPGTIRALAVESGESDKALSDDAVLAALNSLAKRGLVAVDVEWDGGVRWGATAEGKKQWILGGQHRLG